MGMAKNRCTKNFLRSLAGVIIFCGVLSSAYGQADKKSVTCPDGSKAESPKECPLAPQTMSMSGASDGVAPYVEYRKHIEAAQNLSPLDEGLFGESVSLYDGSTTFTVTDIDVPGNNALPVRLARRHAVEIQPQGALFPYDTRLRSIGNWEVDVPYMTSTFEATTGWPSARCSGGSGPALFTARFLRYEVWQGVSVHIPGEGDRSLLSINALTPKPSTGGPYYKTTSQRDVFDCLSSVSGMAGEGFRMTTSSGVKYYFDVARTRTASTLEKWIKDLHSTPKQIFLHRNQTYLLASKIEDRFGNTVQISYDASGHPTQIFSNDGRSITLTYSSDRLVSASSHGRTWLYQYTNSYNPDNLTAVVLPDTSKWIYAYNNDLQPPTDPIGLPWLPYCAQWPLMLGASYTMTVTHPAGAIGTFVFDNKRHTRSGVHAGECFQTGDPANPDFDVYIPYYFDVMSLTTKTINGTGLPNMVWTYDYGSNNQTWWGTWGTSWIYPCTSCATSKFVTVTQPDGSKVRHKFGILYTVNDGRELGVETLTSSNTVLRSEVSDYLSEADAPNQAFYGVYGSIMDMADPSTARVRPVVKSTITQQGRNFVWQVGAGCNGTYCFDTYAQPLKVTKSSAPTP